MVRRKWYNYTPHKLFLSQQCKRFCVLEAVKADCGCFHPLYLDIDGEGARGGIKPCDLGDNTTTLCIDTVLNQFTAELRRCPCNQSCYETKYAASVSTSMWPAKQYEVRTFMIHPCHFTMNLSENSKQWLWIHYNRRHHYHLRRCWSCSNSSRGQTKWTENTTGGEYKQWTANASRSKARRKSFAD